MSTPVEGGRGLGLRLFGFPVHIDLSFVLIMGLIGWLSQARTLPLIVLWLAVATVAILVHELGHAFVARTTGAEPAIALTGFGGLTTYAPPKPLSRVRSLSIALAGPLAGLAVALVLRVIASGLGPDIEPDTLVWYLLDYGIFTTQWWSLLNLVPVLPLDGGQAMRELLPGPPEVRARRAAMVSLVVLVPLFGLAVWTKEIWLGTFLLVFGLANVQTLRGGGQPGVPVPAPGVPPEQAVVTLLWQGDPAQARLLLASLPPDASVDLAVHGAVLATTDQPEQGFALLGQEVTRRPGDVNVVALLVLAHTLRHDWDAVAADLAGPLAPDVPLPVVERAIQEATAVGRPDVAERLAGLPVRRPPAA